MTHCHHGPAERYGPGAVLPGRPSEKTNAQGGAMRRGRRPRAQVTSNTADALEAELQQLKERQAELRQQLRRMKGGEGEIRRLQSRLEGQFARAKWTAEQIKQIRPDWDDWGFYQGVRSRQPAPRGR